MNTRDCLLHLIDITNKQFETSEFKNLFCTTKDQFCFCSEMLNTISLFTAELSNLSKGDVEILLQNYTNTFMRVFYETDPYTNFSKQDRIDIQKIYIALLRDITSKTDLEQIQQRHFARIRKFIKDTNPGIYKINCNPNPQAKHFVSAEYSPELQLDLLKLDRNLLVQPILDIGCGEHGHLVNHLRSHNIAAYGIDCMHESSSFFHNCNWLEFSYGHERWGTIISHLSFTSHFLHHFLQNDGLDLLYAQTYMRILDSLAIGGHWIYTPDVQFIENLLPSEKYNIDRTWIKADFFKTTITKL